MNLLVVDDEYYIVQGILNFVNKEELMIDEIFTAYSADQARRILEKETVDLLLLDIEMPKENGLEFMEWMRQNDYTITTIILTGHQRFDYAHQALEMHCYSYLLKPVNRAKLNSVLGRALRYLRTNKAQPPRRTSDESTEAPESDFVKTVRKYIMDNLSNPDLSRATIAVAIHMNPDYLSYLFHNEFGETLTSYILKSRIDQAKYLIRYSYMPINNICYEVGFKSLSHFYKHFKKLTGMTPLQYKEQ